MSARVLSAAVVGCGPRGLEHADALRDLDGVTLVGAADLEASRRSTAAERLGLAPSDSLGALIAGGAPDLLVLAVPPAGRAELVEEAAAGGVRGIVVEKPFALRLADAERMLDACEGCEARLFVCHQLRFCPHFLELRRAVEAGELGEVRLVHGAGFGNLLDQGPHLIDAALWLAGDRRALWAMSQRGDAATARLPADRLPPAGEAHPAPAWMTHHLALDGGARLTLETGALYQRGTRFEDDWLQKRITVVGTEGSGEVQAAGGGRIIGAGGVRELEGGTDAYFSATGALLAGVRDVLLDGGEHSCDARTALASLEAVLACAQSAADGDAATLPLDRSRDPVAELAGAERGRVSAAGSARPTSTGLEASVIVPLPDARGYALQCVESWLEQTVPDERYELIALSDGSDPALDEQVRARLRPQDRLITEPGAHETLLYHLGGRAARADLFLFTEPHCMAEPRALDELQRFMAGSDYDGACLRSFGLSTTAQARMEERYFEEGFREWSKEGHWCKVILRGFAVRREAYEAVGGFDYRYQRFAEFALGASLHAAGRRLGYAAGAAVQHANGVSLQYNGGAIVDFAEGEAAYRRDHDPEFCERYFGPSPEAGERHALDQGAARSACAAALRNLARRSVLREPAAARAMTSTLARHLPAAILGARPRLWRARAHVAEARLRLLVWRFDEDRLLRAFADSWDRIGALTRLERHAEWAGELPPLEPSTRYEIERIPAERLLGFHAPETLDGEPYRWSRGLAAVDLPLSEPERIRLRTAPARSGRAPLCPWVFVGRRRVPARAVHVEDGDVTVDLRAAGISASGEQRITFTCAPLESDFVPNGDPRELGLPVRAIELESADRPMFRTGITA